MAYRLDQLKEVEDNRKQQPAYNLSTISKALGWALPGLKVWVSKLIKEGGITASFQNGKIMLKMKTIYKLNSMKKRKLGNDFIYIQLTGQKRKPIYKKMSGDSFYEIMAYLESESNGNQELFIEKMIKAGYTKKQVLNYLKKTS